MNQLIKEATTDQSTGKVNREANLMAHALLGAVEAYATGNHVVAGAAGAVSGELAAELLTKQLYHKKDPDELSEAQKQTITALSQLASGLAGGVVGDSTSSAIGAAEIGKRAVENNALANRYGVQLLNDRELALYTKLKAHGVENVDHYAQEYANAKTEQEKEQILRRYQEAVAQSDDIIARLYQTGELSQEEYDLLVTDYATKMLRGAQIGETKLPASFAYTSSIYGLNGLQEWSPLGLSRHQKLGQVYEERLIDELKQQNYPDTFIEQVGFGRNLVQNWLGAVPSEEDIKKADNPLLFYIIRPSSKLPPSGSYDLFSKWLGGKAEYVTPEGFRITSYENYVNPKTANIIQKSRDGKGGIPIGQDFRDNSKKKVNSASRGDIVRTPTSHPDDFTKQKGKQGFKNKYTGEIWEKSGSKHSDKDGEWKIGLDGDPPKKGRKITIGVDDGKIIKIDRK